MRRRLFVNVGLLTLLQAANYLVPLVTLPYLARVLGADGFGHVALCINVFALLGMLTDWGFGLTATQKVARCAADPAALRDIFWDTILARTLLGAVGLSVCAVAVAVVPGLWAQRWLFLVGAVGIVPSMVNVGWFLQGLERMGSLVVATMASRAVVIPLTLLLVHSPRDVAMAVLIPGLAGLVWAALALRMAMRLAPLRPVRVSVPGAVRQLRSGFGVFVSTASIALYGDSHVLVLAALASPEQVGFFGAADRIRRALQALIGPLSGALFPRINNLMASDRAQAHRLMLLMLAGQGALTILIGTALYLVAPLVVPLLLGPAFMAAIPVVQGLAPFVALIGITNVLGTNMMVPLGMTAHFAAISTASIPVNLLAMLVLCPRYGAVGAAASATATEVFVTLAMAGTLLLSQESRVSLLLRPQVVPAER